MTLPRRVFLLAALATVACARPPQPPAAQNPVAPAGGLAPGTLARFAALRIVVLPVQLVAPSTIDGWTAFGAGGIDERRAFDDMLERELTDRGLGTQWVYPAALAQSARRNPTYLTDPYTLRALDGVRLAMRRAQDPIPEPIAGQLRALTAVSDARYALVPLDMRIAGPGGPAGAQAFLRLAFIDTRGSAVVWTGEVSTEPQTGYSPAAFLSLVQRVADLIVPRP